MRGLGCCWLLPGSRRLPSEASGWLAGRPLCPTSGCFLDRGEAGWPAVACAGWEALQPSELGAPRSASSVAAAFREERGGRRPPEAAAFSPARLGAAGSGLASRKKPPPFPAGPVRVSSAHSSACVGGSLGKPSWVGPPSSSFYSPPVAS